MSWSRVMSQSHPSWLAVSSPKLKASARPQHCNPRCDIELLRQSKRFGGARTIVVEHYRQVSVVDELRRGGIQRSKARGSVRGYFIDANDSEEFDGPVPTTVAAFSKAVVLSNGVDAPGMSNDGLRLLQNIALHISLYGELK